MVPVRAADGRHLRPLNEILEWQSAASPNSVDGLDGLVDKNGAVTGGSGFVFGPIHHVQLAVPPDSEAACRGFWGEILGMRELEKPAALVARGGCWFRSGGLEVHLGVEADFRPARKAHPGLLVSNPSGSRRSSSSCRHRHHHGCRLPRPRPVLCPRSVRQPTGVPPADCHCSGQMIGPTGRS